MRNKAEKIDITVKPDINVKVLIYGKDCVSYRHWRDKVINLIKGELFTSIDDLLVKFYTEIGMSLNMVYSTRHSQLFAVDLGCCYRGN